MKTIKLISILALMLLTSVTANAQNSLVGDVNKDGRVNITDAMMVVDIILHGQKELSLSVNEISLSKGNSATIVITSGYGSYTVSSTDTNIADATLVGSTVIITGKKGGTTVVKVIDTISGNIEEVNVKVLAPLSFSANSAELEIGKTTTINITSGNGNYEVTSSNANVVEVSLSGTTIVLTGKAKGNATVTVKDVVTGSTEDVSVTVKDAPISYSKCPDGNHPHLIDLGLPSGTKWACCNVGADKPEAYGGYYAWGETEEKEVYDTSTYKYYQNGEYVNLGSDISGTEYDVAHVKWGGKWCMPIIDEIKELFDNCTYERTMVNGVKGLKVTSKSNSVSIFLPATGFRIDGDLYLTGEIGYYWSSTQDRYESCDANYLYIARDADDTCLLTINREHGYSVRPVVRN